MLKNKKVKVGNAEQSKAIQEKAFELGWGWYCNRKEIRNVNEPYLFFDDAFRIEYCNNEDYFVNANYCEEVTPEWILSLKTTKEMENKQIFKVGDRVFVAKYGWGIIEHIGNLSCSVKFDIRREDCIRKIPTNLISFQEYTLDGFSQERPINWNDYVGKWGKFYDKSKLDKDIHISKLLRYKGGVYDYPFETLDKCVFSGFEPLTEEQIKILNLK